MTQQKAEPIAGACRKREAAGCGEIGRRTRFRQLSDNRGKRGRFQRLLKAPERINRPRHPQDQQPIHGEAERIEACPIGLAAFERRIVGLDPKGVWSMRSLGGMPRLRRDRQREAERRPEMRRRRRRDLVQGPQGKAASKQGIDGRQTQRQDALFRAKRKTAVRLKTCERLAERSQSGN